MNPQNQLNPLNLHKMSKTVLQSININKYFNDPVRVRNAPEKLYVTHFPELMPPTLITADRQEILAFRAEHKDIIVKPLYGNGGASVFRIKEGDSNINSLIELFQIVFREPFMLQQYRPEVRNRDTRTTLDEREAAQTEAKVLGQVRAGLAGRTPQQVAALVIAYEPIWAIGTGRTATSADAQQVCGAIRACVNEGWGADAASSVRIQYGGSVKGGNIAELMAQPDIDGALVGGASLDADEFARICKPGG